MGFVKFVIDRIPFEANKIVLSNFLYLIIPLRLLAQVLKGRPL
jgi:hypothetical protein